MQVNDIYGIYFLHVAQLIENRHLFLLLATQFIPWYIIMQPSFCLLFPAHNITSNTYITSFDEDFI